MTFSILLADPDEALRAALAAALRGAGYAVREAANGRAAIRMLDEAAPNIVVTEILMPEADGFEVMAAMQTRRTGAIVIATCANPHYGGLDLLLLAARLGAHATLAKPFDAARLLESVKKARGPRAVA